MKVALVSAAWPPVRCGVGDYTSLLAGALEAAGATVVRFGATPRPFGTAAARGAARALAATGADIVHVQYPATGYGRSLLPALLPLLLRDRPVLATLHEFTIFRAYRWPWFAPYAYAAAATVFTNAAERAAFIRRMPGATTRTTVIPIGSNIPSGHPTARDKLSVCYFGLLMPRKGIEEFLEMASRLRETAPEWRAVLIGAVPPGQEAYAATVTRHASAAGVVQHIGLPPDGVANLLQGIGYAYLPGPGGITTRRGSVLAALENGVRVIGPVGDAAPDWLRALVVAAATPAEAARVLTGPGLPGPPAATVPAETSWSAIASRHLELYETMLAGRGTAQ